MGAPDLIFELRRTGYSIRADGGYLDISPADNLPPDLVQQLKQSKAEILTELQRETEDLQEAFEERAAIMEFDGGLPRHEAEALAKALH